MPKNHASLSEFQALENQMANPPIIPTLLTTCNAIHPRLFMSSLSWSNPSGSCGLSALLLLLPPVRPPLLRLPCRTIALDDMSPWVLHWDIGTIVPSATHSPSLSVSQTARSLRASSSYRNRSFWRLRWRSAAQLASRICASRSSL